MTHLTKENFWNDLSEKYPAEMSKFEKWIDGYKIRVKWLWLFGCYSLHDITYPDLPIAMQVGVFIQYTTEQKHWWEKLPLRQHKTMQDWADEIKIWFEVASYYNNHPLSAKSKTKTNDHRAGK